MTEKRKRERKLVVTGAFRWADDQLAQLASLGYEITLVQNEFDILPDEAYSAEVIVCNRLFDVHPPSVFPRLRFVQLTSAGTDHVPVQQLRAGGVTVVPASGVYAVPIAEWVVGQILSHFKNDRGFDSAQQAREWKKDRALRELAGSSVCIVGAGAIAQAIGKRLQSFDVNIVAVSRQASRRPYLDTVDEYSSLLHHAANADVLVVAAALSDDTRRLVDARVLQTLRPGSVLVNVSRGGIVVERALEAHLLNGSLRGASVDVFETEPLPPTSTLWGAPNLRITPHNSFVSDRSTDRLFAVVQQSLRTYIETGVPSRSHDHTGGA